MLIELIAFASTKKKGIPVFIGSLIVVWFHRVRLREFSFLYFQVAMALHVFLGNKTHFSFKISN